MQQDFKRTSVYSLFTILCLLPLGLLFSGDVWFDETYTLSIIKHSYQQMSDILAEDMHPPLYFFALKFFCRFTGYSVFSTKAFSCLGLIATLALGPISIMPNYGRRTAMLYMLAVGAVPMFYYFGFQQRSYSWCIFLVTLCYIYAAEFIRERRQYRAVIFTLAGMAAAYCHIYAMLAVGIIFLFTNIYVFYIRSRRGVSNILLADLMMISGCLPQLFTLVNQVKAAGENFWLQGVEPLSVILLAVGIALAVWVLWDKKRRNADYILSLCVILGLQAVGLLVTVFIRPVYIGRYSVVVLGIFALTLARLIRHSAEGLKKWLCIGLIAINLLSLGGTYMLEFGGKLSDDMKRIGELAQNKQVVCLDSSFGIISHYLQGKKILVTYNQDWFAAFKGVESIGKDELADRVENTAVMVKNKSKAMPDYITKTFYTEKVDTFRSDFNSFEVYIITEKE